MFSERLLQDLTGKSILEELNDLDRGLQSSIVNQHDYNEYDDREFKQWKHITPVKFQSNFFDVASLYDFLLQFLPLIERFAANDPAPDSAVVKEIYNAWLAKVALFHLRCINLTEPTQTNHGDGTFMDAAERALRQIDQDSSHYPQVCFELAQQYLDNSEVAIDKNHELEFIATAFRYLVVCLNHPLFKLPANEKPIEKMLISVSQQLLTPDEMKAFDNLVELIDIVTHLAIPTREIIQQSTKDYPAIAAQLTQLQPMAVKNALGFRQKVAAIKQFETFTYDMESILRNRVYLRFHRLPESEVHPLQNQLALLRKALNTSINPKTLNEALNCLSNPLLVSLVTQNISERRTNGLFEHPVTSLEQFREAFLARNQSLFDIEQWTKQGVLPSAPRN